MGTKNPQTVTADVVLVRTPDDWYHKSSTMVGPVYEMPPDGGRGIRWDWGKVSIATALGSVVAIRTATADELERIWPKVRRGE